MPTTLEDIPLGRLLPHGSNPRVELGDLDDLAESIKAQGILQPLIVAPLNGTQYTIIAGHRRHAAAKKAGLLNVPCEIREDLDTPAKQLVAILVENTQRRDLTVVEEGDAYTQLVAFSGWTQAKAAKETGRDAKTVKARIAISKLPDKARSKIASGQATLADALILAEHVNRKADYKRLENALGGPNFRYEVNALKERQNRGARAAAVRKHAKEHGWTTTSDRAECGRHVHQAYDFLNKTPAEMLKKLDRFTGETYVLLDNGDYWAIHEPKGDTLDQPDDTADDTAADERRARWEENLARTAELALARPARLEHIFDRIPGIVTTPGWREAMLRLLVLDAVEDEMGFKSGYSGDVDAAQTLGIPVTVDDEDGSTSVGTEPMVNAWAWSAPEKVLWKALICLRFGLLDDTQSVDGHVLEIRLAEALGYEPADVETAALARAEEA